MILTMMINGNGDDGDDNGDDDNDDKDDREGADDDFA